MSCWVCRVCHLPQRSADIYVCDRCIRPLMDKLCREMFKVDLAASHVHESYFKTKAYDYAKVLFGKTT